MPCKECERQGTGQPGAVTKELGLTPAGAWFFHAGRTPGQEDVGMIMVCTEQVTDVSRSAELERSCATLRVGVHTGPL